MAEEGEGEPIPVDPIELINEKYAPQLKEKMALREGVVKQLEAVASDFQSELDKLMSDYNSAKQAAKLEEQLMLGGKIDQLQMRSTVHRDFRKQAVADLDQTISRLTLDKAREVAAEKAKQAAAAAEE